MIQRLNLITSNLALELHSFASDWPITVDYRIIYIETVIYGVIYQTVSVRINRLISFLYDARANTYFLANLNKKPYHVKYMCMQSNTILFLSFMTTYRTIEE